MAWKHRLLSHAPVKTLVPNQQEAVKSPFKLEFFTEPRPGHRTNPLRLKNVKNAAWCLTSHGSFLNLQSVRKIANKSRQERQLYNF